MFDYEALLQEQNPHWKTDYVFLESGGERDVFYEIATAMENNNLIKILEGPRRTGKTYLVKQLINHFLITKHVPTTNILYYQFKGNQDRRDFIEQLLRYYLKSYADKTKPIYIFLDEIQLIKYWQDDIKQCWDFNQTIRFLVTGSTSLFSRSRSRESLAGRTDKFKIGGLSFLEYLRFKKFKDLPEYFHFNKDIKLTDRINFKSFLPVFKTHFKQYLTMGQYPKLTADPTLDPKKYVAELTDTIVDFDLPYIHKILDRELFLKIVRILAADIAGECSFSNIAKSQECDRRTVAEYIKILDEAHLFSLCLNAAFKSARKKLYATKKVYALNTNLALNINGFDISYLNDSRVFGQYFENYAYSRISELFKHAEYYRSSNREIDLIAGNYAFEIKSGNIRNSDETKYLELAQKLKKKLVFITESEFEATADYLKVPIYLL